MVPLFHNVAPFCTTTPIAFFGVPSVVIKPLLYPTAFSSKYIPIAPSAESLITPSFFAVEFGPTAYIPILPPTPIVSTPVTLIVPLLIIFPSSIISLTRLPPCNFSLAIPATIPIENLLSFIFEFPTVIIFPALFMAVPFFIEIMPIFPTPFWKLISASFSTLPAE